MTYKLKVIKDYPIGFWLLDEISGNVAEDNSGCGNISKVFTFVI